MSKRWAARVSGVLVVAMFIIALCAIRQLPAGAQIAIHWGPDNRPDSWLGQQAALFMVPIVSAVLWFLLSMAPENAQVSQQRQHVRYSRVFIILFVVQTALAIFALRR